MRSSCGSLNRRAHEDGGKREVSACYHIGSMLEVGNAVRRACGLPR